MANESRFTECKDLQAILDAPMPDRWDDEALWKLHRDEMFQQAVIALWGCSEMIQSLGWLEHTNDWDWRASFTFREGIEARTEYDCGTYIVGLRDREGKEYRSFKEFAETWSDNPDRRLESLLLDAMWYEDDDLNDLREELVLIPIWDLDSISLSYDT
jgi:hypothetical protein